MSRNLAVRTSAELYPPKCDEAITRLADEIVAFRPAGGGPVELRRALSADERGALTTRANVIDRWLEPGRQSDIATSVSQMMLGFGGRNASVEDTMEIATQWAHALRDLPGWAVARACLRFGRGEVRAAELGIERLDVGFSPSTAQVHRIAKVIAADAENERARLGAVLKGVVPTSAPAKPMHVDRPGMNAIDAHVLDAKEAAELRDDERFDKQKREAPEIERKANQARADEYRRAGLEPPEAQHGLIVSLSLKLSMGWRIEEDGRGNRVLLSPGKVRADEFGDSVS